MKKLCALCLVLLSVSCASKKSFVYFQDYKEHSANGGILSEAAPVLIQHDDILAILVSSINGNASAPYNLVRPDLPTGQFPITDFLVDQEGNIEYPGLGTIKVQGMTIVELKSKLRALLRPYLTDAVVNVRISNFRVNVIGEVRNPSTYVINEEKRTLLEVLAQAGDITGFGDRERVVVIREVNGKRDFKEINLLNADVFESEYFYLRQNDTVYVPPTNGKAVSARSAPLSQVVLPVLGVLTSLASLIIVATR